jgi:hypothetical protein
MFMCRVAVNWEDQTGPKTQTGMLEDRSPSGAGISLRKPIPAGTKVKIQENNRELAGIVRYCRPEEFGYFLGVRLDGQYDVSRASRNASKQE